MKINIHDLANKSEVTFKGEQAVSLSGLNLFSHTQNCLVNVEGTITKKGNRYLVLGNIESIIQLSCDRCGEQFGYPIQAELYQEFSADVIAEDEDIIHITTSNIDLYDIIAEAVCLSVPMKRLCDEDCKGMCNVCGKNLNEHICSCEKAEIDPRLEKLKNIFHSQSEE